MKSVSPWGRGDAKGKSQACRLGPLTKEISVKDRDTVCRVYQQSSWLQSDPANLESSDPLAMTEIDLVYAAVYDVLISWERHTHLVRLRTTLLLSVMS
jgi:hypothetical protein